jgi:hypothetical protein
MAMAKDDQAIRPKSMVSAPVSKVTIAFPFSNIKTTEPSDAVRELAAIVVELAERVAKLDPSTETDALRDRATALIAKVQLA